MSQSISSPSIYSLSQAAQAICKVLDKHGYRDSYMFVGKAAQCIYMRNSLSPSTLEIVFLKQAPTASLKQLIHNLNPNNFTYIGNEGVEKKLQWCSPLSTTSIIEVVFLEPLPAHRDAGIQVVDHYPLIPFPHLVLQSVLAWYRATRMADRLDFAGQASAMLQFLHTRSDLQRPIASDKVSRIGVVPIVERFYFNYPGHLEEWKALGFLSNRSPPSLQASSTQPQNLPTPATISTTSGSKQSTTSTQSQDVESRPQVGTTVPTTPGGQATGTASKSRKKKGKKKEVKDTPSKPLASNSGNGKRQQVSDSQPITTQDPPKRATTKAGNAQQSTPQRVTPKNRHDRAAHTTITILRRMRFTSALFGGMARNLYGNPRSPNDIDLLVVPPASNSEISQEGIKHLLFEHCPSDSHFVLLDNHDENGSNRLLYWVPGQRPMPKITPAARAKKPSVRARDKNAPKQELASGVSSLTIHDSDGGSTVVKPVKEETTSSASPTANIALRPLNPKAVKVNIFIPGTMNLPDIPAYMIAPLGPLSFPCVPYPLLLVMKLQEWSDNKTSNSASPIRGDLADLEWLLGPKMNQEWNEYKDSFGLDVENRGREKSVVGVWRDRRLFSDELEMLTRERVREVCWEHPEMSKGFLEIGLQPS